MTNRYLSEVRDQLTSRATRTTLQELQRRGLEQVRVIRSSQVLQLIEESVDRALRDRGIQAGDAERSEVLEASTQNFREALQQQTSDSESQRLRERIVEIEGALDQSRRRSAQMQAELLVMHKRVGTMNSEQVIEELRALREDVGRSVEAQPKVASIDTSGLEKTLQSLSDSLGREIEKISRKVGIQSVEEIPADLSALFRQDLPALENNLDIVEATERKAGDVSDAVKRMRSLRRSS